MAGIELILFKAACLVFVFGIKTVLLTHGCFSCWWVVLTRRQGCSCFLCCPFWQARSTQGAGRVQLISTGQRDILYHTTPRSTIRARVKKEEGEDTHSDSVCLPKKSLRAMSPAFLGVAEQLPDNGKQWMNSWLCFDWVPRFCCT